MKSVLLKNEERWSDWVRDMPTSIAAGRRPALRLHFDIVFSLMTDHAKCNHNINRNLCSCQDDLKKMAPLVYQLKMHSIRAIKYRETAGT